MATVTKNLGGIGPVTWEIDYDDATLRITGFRCINPSTQAAYGEAMRVSDGLVYGSRFSPGTTFIAIPTTTVAARLQMSLDPRGRLDGVSYSFMWPYP